MRLERKSVDIANRPRGMRILIAHERPVACRGLSQMLTGGVKDAIVDEVCGVKKTLDRLGRQRWDLVVLEISSRGRCGLELLKAIKQFHPKLPVVALSAQPESRLAVRALKWGALGYVAKASVAKELMAAIQKVSAGGRYVIVAVTRSKGSYLAIDAEPMPHERLSKRELALFRLLVAGKRVGEIGRELSWSVKAISNCQVRVLAKMGAENVGDLIRYAIRNRLIE